MRRPSSRILRQTADVYAAASGQDVAGGYAPIYPTTPTTSDVPCSAQPHDYEEVVENDRLTMHRRWKITFASYVAVKIRDRIDFVNDDGVKHSVYVQAWRDEAGRGMAFTAIGTEKI